MGEQLKIHTLQEFTPALELANHIDYLHGDLIAKSKETQYS
jgi:hypothetical protein